MGDGSILAGRGVATGQVAEIIVTLDGEPGRRGSAHGRLRHLMAAIDHHAGAVVGQVNVDTKTNEIPGTLLPCSPDRCPFSG